MRRVGGGTCLWKSILCRLRRVINVSSACLNRLFAGMTLTQRDGLLRQRTSCTQPSRGWSVGLKFVSSGVLLAWLTHR